MGGGQFILAPPHPIDFYPHMLHVTHLLDMTRHIAATVKFHMAGWPGGNNRLMPRQLFKLLFYFAAQL